MQRTNTNYLLHDAIESSVEMPEKEAMERLSAAYKQSPQTVAKTLDEKTKETVLHKAVRLKHIVAIKFLRENKLLPSFEQRNKAGESVLDMMAKLQVSAQPARSPGETKEAEVASQPLQKDNQILELLLPSITDFWPTGLKTENSPAYLALKSSNYVFLEASLKRPPKLNSINLNKFTLSEFEKMEGSSQQANFFGVLSEARNMLPKALDNSDLLDCLLRSVDLRYLGLNSGVDQCNFVRAIFSHNNRALFKRLFETQGMLELHAGNYMYFLLRSELPSARSQYFLEKFPIRDIHGQGVGSTDIVSAYREKKFQRVKFLMNYCSGSPEKLLQDLQDFIESTARNAPQDDAMFNYLKAVGCIHQYLRSANKLIPIPLSEELQQRDRAIAAFNGFGYEDQQSLLLFFHNNNYFGLENFKKLVKLAVPVADALVGSAPSAPGVGVLEHKAVASYGAGQSPGDAKGAPARLSPRDSASAMALQTVGFASAMQAAVVGSSSAENGSKALELTTGDFEEQIEGQVRKPG